jgi:hypothetical protein
MIEQCRADADRRPGKPEIPEKAKWFRIKRVLWNVKSATHSIEFHDIARQRRQNNASAKLVCQCSSATTKV